jgi:hypothetical protein
MELTEIKALLKFWDKTKKDFSRGRNFGDKIIGWLKRKPAVEPTQPSKEGGKEEPKKSTASKKKYLDPDKKTSKKKQLQQLKDFQGANDSGKGEGEGKSKSVAKKYKEMKKQVKKRDCKPAPKAKGKIRCRKPGGGYAYYDKMNFKSSSK